MEGIASSHGRGPGKAGKGCKIFGLDELEIENPLTCWLRTFILCKQM